MKPKNDCIKIQRVRGGKMNEMFSIFLIGLGMAAAPEVQKEALRRAAQPGPVKILGSPTLVRFTRSPSSRR
jgi:hypothetical protein